MESKYTKGETVSNGLQVFSNGKPIGQAFLASGQIAISEAKANATLWAAAPELLEALEKVYRLAKQIGLAEDLDFEEIDYIGNAINKAKGV